jgi:hypothetical protein
MATRRPATRSGGRSSKTRTSTTSSSKTRTSSTSSSKTRSSRTRAPESEARPGRKGKAKKKNNTPLFIGIGVGVFALLMIIIVAANSSDGSGSGAGTGDSYMSVSQKQSIFKDYMSRCSVLEKEVEVALAGMDADTKKKGTRGIYKNLRNRKVALANRMEGKHNKNHKKVPEGYFYKNIVEYGQKNDWK